MKNPKNNGAVLSKNVSRVQVSAPKRLPYLSQASYIKHLFTSCARLLSGYASGTRSKILKSPKLLQISFFIFHGKDEFKFKNTPHMT